MMNSPRDCDEDYQERRIKKEKEKSYIIHKVTILASSSAFVARNP